MNDAYNCMQVISTYRLCKLKSGGPLMMITGLIDNGDGIIGALCLWANVNEQKGADGSIGDTIRSMHRSIFAVRTLELL